MIALVLLAGGVGAVLRYAATLVLRSPFGVLLVNAIASLITGLAIGTTLDPAWRLVLLTGFAGGLSTFSTFSVDTVELAMSGRPWRAVANVAANLGVGILLAAAGFALARLR